MNPKTKNKIDKVKEMFTWLRVLLVGIPLAGGGAGTAFVYGEEIIGYLAKDTIIEEVDSLRVEMKKEITDSQKELKDEVTEHFTLMFELLVQADPKFKRAAEERAKQKKEKESTKSLIRAITN